MRASRKEFLRRRFIKYFEQVVYRKGRATTNHSNQTNRREGNRNRGVRRGTQRRHEPRGHFPFFSAYLCGSTVPYSSFFWSWREFVSDFTRYLLSVFALFV